MRKLVILLTFVIACIPMKIVAVKEYRLMSGTPFYEYFANDWDTDRNGNSTDRLTYLPVHVGQDVCVSGFDAHKYGWNINDSKLAK